MNTWKLLNWTTQTLSDEIVVSDERPQPLEGYSELIRETSFMLNGEGYNYILQVEPVMPKELKKGDCVVFYGHLYDILEDAQPSRTPGCNAWYAKCKIRKTFTGWSSDILNTYDSFQGNDSAKVERCIQA